MAESKKIAVTVAGQSFYLKTEQNEEYLVSLANTLDSRIEAMREANPSLTALKAAVLISMELLDDYNKLEADYEEFRKEMEQLKF
ncbi:MAG: cell division protein ZapA [Firmicutes bacterium]|nr:cell division protein ZapA [Bacillota bacterium]MBQ4091999.1 cell division protein ZapA [Bacillota bacterium]MBQ6810327.1 cell division protein ZapA [Bacillota bacterium]